MEIIKLSLIAVIAAVLCVYFKRYGAEYSVFIAALAGCLIFINVLPYFKDLNYMVQAFADKGNVSESYLKPALKTVGISYITQYSAELCKDAGESALAAKLEMAGKIVLLAMAVPLMTSVLDTILGIM